MAESNSGNARRFRVHVGDEPREIIIDDDRLLVDGVEREASFLKVREGHFSLILDGRSHSVIVDSDESGDLQLLIDGRRIEVRVQDEKAMLLERFGMAKESAQGVREIRSPMPGLVVRVLVGDGEEVESGDGLVVLEAMKMENELKAEADGRIKKIHVATGDAVSKNALLVEFEV